jgi:uncharacterized protein YkwD
MGAGARLSDSCHMPVPPSRLQHRRALLLSSLLLTILAFLAVPTFASAKRSGCRGADDTPTAATLGKARAATLCLLNRERRARGLRSLRSHRSLTLAAQRYAGAMVEGGFFSHVSPTGSTLEERIREGTRYLAGALRYEIGENIAWGQGELAKPRAIVAAWMASPGHRANILRGAFREIGIGIEPGAPVPGIGGGAVTYTNEFGARR